MSSIGTGTVALNGDAEFKNGIIYNSTNSFSLNRNTLFTTNNQTISGIGTSNFSTGASTIAGIIVTNQLNPIWVMTGSVTGTDVNSTLENDKLLSIRFAAEPMAIGNLVSTSTSSILWYENTGIRTIKGGTYYTIILAGIGTKTLNGDVTTNIIGINGALSFGNSVARTLSVTGTLTVSNTIDMSGTLAHQLYISANAINSLAGLNLLAGSGTVHYNRASIQNILPFTYNNLILINSQKNLLNSTTITGNLNIATNATLSCSNVANQNILFALGNSTINGMLDFGTTVHTMAFGSDVGIQNLVGNGTIRMKGSGLAHVWDNKLDNNNFTGTIDADLPSVVAFTKDNMVFGQPLPSKNGINAYPNVLMSGQSPKQQTFLSLINGDLTVTGATFNTGSANGEILTVVGNTLLDGSTAILSSLNASSPQIFVFKGDFEIKNDARLNISLTIGNKAVMYGANNVATNGNLSADCNNTLEYALLGNQRMFDFGNANAITHQLLISGSGTKTVTSAINVCGLSITGTSTLYTSDKQITGTVTEKMLMESGTSLILGNPANATAVLFPTNFTRPNINLAPASTVVYQSFINQNISAVPTYGNLYIDGSGIVKSLDGNTTVLGSLWIKNGHLDFNTSVSNLDVIGASTVNGVLQFTGATTQLVAVTFNSDLLVTNQLNFANNFAHNVNVLGDFNCSNTLNMTGVATAPYSLNLFGANNTINQSNFSTNPNGTVAYRGTITQNIAQLNTNPYANLVVSGGGIKSILNDTKANTLHLDGAVVQMVSPKLLYVNSITGSVVYDVNNMVSADPSGVGGTLVKLGTANNQFKDFVFPIGVNGIYSSVSIVGINASSYNGTGEIRIKPIDTILGSNYMSRMFEISSASIVGITDFKTQFFVDPSQVNGTPNLVKINGITLPNSFVDGSSASFGYINAANNSSINGTWFATANPIPTFFRSIATGNWNDPTKWEGSADGISYYSLVSGQYPGASASGDMVSISGATTITGNVSPLELASITVSGTWNIGANNYTIAGQTLINSGGGYITGIAAPRTYFIDKVFMSAGSQFLTGANAYQEFQNGFVNNTSFPADFSLNGHTKFALNNQTISGSLANYTFCYGLLEVDNDVTVESQSRFVDLAANTSLIGLNANSTWRLGSNNNAIYTSSSVELMKGGILNATLPSTFVAYLGNNQKIKNTNYYTIQIGNPGTKIIEGQVNATFLGNISGFATLSFSGAQLSVLSVTSDFYLNYNTNGADMSGGGFAHRLYIGGATNTISGAFTAGNGNIIYNGTGSQEIIDLDYNNLEVSGNSTKSLTGNTSISGTLNMNGGVLDLGIYSLTTSGITPTTVYSPLNMIRMSGTTTLGILCLRNPISGFEIVYPVGTANDYTPVFFSTLNSSLISTEKSVRIQIVTLTGGTNRINRAFNISTNGLEPANNFTAEFIFVPSDIVGTPNNVNRYSPTQNAIASGVVDFGLFKYTVNETASGALSVSGLWVAESNPVPTMPLGNRGIYFDGVDDYVSCGSSINTVLHSTAFTVEAWVKLPKVNAEYIILSNRTTSNNGLSVSIGSGQLSFSFGNVAVVSSPSVLTDVNKWYHVAVSYGAGNVNFYVDGVLVHNSTISPINPSNIGATLGRSEFLSVYSNFQADEIKIFNTARTASEIRADMSSTATGTAGMVAYWNFEDDAAVGNQTIATDVTANTNDGTLTNGPLWALRVTDNTDNGGAGLGSLRQAITDANSDNDKDYIDFSMPSGTQTIQPTTTYNLTQPVFIDGFSQLNTIAGENSIPNSNSFGLPINAKLNVVISGPAPGNATCFDLGNTSSGSIFKGLVVNHFGLNGSTAAFNLASDSNNHTISGCFLGVNRDGTAVTAAELNNVSLLALSTSALVLGGNSDADRNLVSSGELFWNGSTNNTITGNYFGTNAAGDTYLSNVIITSIWGNSPMLFQNNVISGTLLIESAISNTKIINNRFGTKADGTGVVTNGAQAIQIGNTSQSRGSSNVLIANNIIANKSTGVIVDGNLSYQSLNNSITGNNIYDNTIVGIFLQGTGNNNKPTPLITSANPGLISGTCVAGDVVEVFNDTPQSGTTNQGRTFLGRATTTGTNWSFVGIFTVGNRITATATDATNGTSAFSVAALVSNPPVPTMPLGNRGIYFDGVNDEISAPAPTTNLDNITLEAWVKMSPDYLGGQIVRVGQTGGGYAIFHSPVSIELSGVGYLFTGHTLTPNQWTHIAIVRNASVWNVFVNGILEPITSTGIPSNSTPNAINGNFLNIGGRNNGIYKFFKGQVDEVRSFDTPRTQAQIQADMSSTLPNGAVGYWNFDETTGNTLLNAGTVGAPSNGTFIDQPLRALRVTNNSDNGGAGLGSLRQAIIDANTDADKDYIDFSLPSGTQTIQPTTTYNLTQPVLIDGFSQLNTLAGENSIPNSNAFGLPINAKLNVVINGVSAGTNNGFLFAGDFAVLKGLVINGFSSSSAVEFNTALPDVRYNQISGCFIGTNREGNIAVTNSLAIRATSTTANTRALNTIGGSNIEDFNLISGNQTALPDLNGFGTGLIMHNYIGTNAQGTAALSNTMAQPSISIIWSLNTTITSNVISGNAGGGITIGSNTSSNIIITNNRIGTLADGTGTLPNAGNGIVIDANNSNKIGGNGAMDGNIIANNVGYGIVINNSNTNNEIFGNSIFNNTNGAILLSNNGNNNKSAPIISSAFPTLISGTCTAGDIVEVFYDSPQSGTTDQGRVFLGTAVTVGTNWSFAGVFTVTSRITATATDGTSGTSAFSVAAIVIPTTPGEALAFDGANDYVQTNSLWLTLISDFTLEASVLWKGNTGSNQAIIYNGNAGANGYGIVIEAASANSLNILVGGVQWISTGAVLPINVWSKIVVVNTAGIWTLYLNGLAQTLTPVNNSVPTTISGVTNSYIGSDNTPGSFFNGIIDEVRIWDRALCPTEITSISSCETPSFTSGLVAKYDFNQGLGSGSNTSINTLADASGNNNTGTLNNFSLNGSISNFITGGGVVTGSTCTSNVCITPTLTGISLTGSSLCAGSTYNLSIAGTGTFTGGNIFKIELSDYAGNFGAHTFLTSFTGILPNTVVGITIPGGVLEGTAYNIRVSSSLPSTLYLLPNLTITNLNIDLNSGLVAYYPFDGNANDASGNGNNGVITGGVVPAPDRFGKVSGSMLFNGGSDIVRVANSSSLNSINTGITISMWLKQTATNCASGCDENIPSGGYVILDKALWNSSDGGYRIDARGTTNVTGKRTRFISGNGALPVDQEANVDYSLNKWVNLTVKYDLTNVYFYYDGQLTNIVNSPLAQISSNTFDLAIGGIQDALLNNTGFNFKGSLDDIRIYNRVLSDAEIAALYQGSQVCEGTAFTLQSPTFAGANYVWTGGTGTLSSTAISNPTVFGASAGTQIYSSTITKNGCTAPLYNTTVVVNSLPGLGTPVVVIQPLKCVNQQIQAVQVGGDPNVSYTWLGSNLEYHNNRFIPNTTYIPTTSGIASVSLTGINTLTGCSNLWDRGTYTISGIPTITGVAPNPVVPGTPVTFFGTNFVGQITNAGFFGGSQSSLNPTASQVVVIVPTSAQSSIVTLSGLNACGNALTNQVLTVTTGNLYRSVASGGNWSNTAIWEKSNDGGTSFSTTSNYPGKLANNDLVSISGLHTVTLDVSPLALGNVTVSGTLNSATSTKIIFGGNLLNNTGGTVLLNGESEFRNGLEQKSANSINLNGNSFFTTNNQTVSGIGTGLIASNLTSIVGVTITNKITQWQFNASVTGTEANSVLNNENGVWFNFVNEPMPVGKLVSTLSGSIIAYNCNLPQLVKGGNYSKVAFLLNTGLKTLFGDLTTGEINLNAPLSFGNTGLINLNVTSALNIGIFASVTMSGFAHNFTVPAGFNINNGASMNATSGTVHYIGNNANLLPGTYNNLVLSGGAKSLTGNTSVTGTLGMNGAVLALGAFNLSISGNLGSAINPVVPFSNTNKIVNSGTGNLIRNQNTAIGFTNFVFPIGTSTAFTPVTILGFGGSINTDNSLSVRVDDFVGASDYVPYKITIASGANTALGMNTFKFQFQSPTVIGLPNAMLDGTTDITAQSIIDNTTRLYASTFTSPAFAYGATKAFTVQSKAPAFYRSTATSMAWTDPAWEVSNDGGTTWASAGSDYPGRFTVGDLVSITGGNTVICAGCLPLPLAGLSITGTLTFSGASNLSVTGATQINASQAKIASSSANAKFVFKGKITNNGTFDLSTCQMAEIQNGISNNSANFSLANGYFTTNFQTCSGTSAISLFGNTTINGIRVLFQNLNNTINGPIDGVNTLTSEIYVENNASINYFGGEMPMKNGKMTFGPTLSSFNYARNGDQNIKASTYTNIQLSGSGIKMLSKSMLCDNMSNVAGSTAVLSFSGSNPITLVGSNFINFGVGTGFDMSGGNQPHRLSLTNNVNPSIINGTFTAGNGTVAYKSTNTSIPQQILALNYNNLEVSGNLKQLTSSINIKQLLILNGAVIDIGNNNLSLTGANATLSGTFSNSNYINTTGTGFLYRNIPINTGTSTVYEFPIGSNGVYAPAKLTASNFATGNPIGFRTGLTTTGFINYVNRYFNITRDIGGISSNSGDIKFDFSYATSEKVGALPTQVLINGNDVSNPGSISTSISTTSFSVSFLSGNPVNNYLINGTFIAGDNIPPNFTIGGAGGINTITTTGGTITPVVSTTGGTLNNSLVGWTLLPAPPNGIANINTFTGQVTGLSNGVVTLVGTIGTVTGSFVITVSGVCNYGTISANGIPKQCQSDDYTINIIGAQTNIAYNYLTSQGLGASFINPVNIISPFTLIVPAFETPTGLQNIKIVATVAGCPRATLAGINVDVLGVPTLNPIPASRLKICSGEILNLQLTSSITGATFDVAPSILSGSVAGEPSIGASVSINPIVRTLSGSGILSYGISINPPLSYGIVCGSFSTVNVTVSSAPTPNLLVLGDTVCAGSGLITVLSADNDVSYQAFDNANNAIGASIKYIISSVDKNVVLTIPSSAFTNQGVYDFTVKAQGCKTVDLQNGAKILVQQTAAGPTILVNKTPGSGCDRTNTTLSVSGFSTRQQWKFGNSIIAGATGKSYKPVLNGSYSAEVQAGRGCLATAGPIQVNLGNNSPKPTITQTGGGSEVILNASSAAYFQWYVGKKAIVGANAQTYQAYYNANYRVQTGVGIRDVCNQFSDDYVVSNADFEDISRFTFEETDSTITLVPQHGLVISPVPARDIVNITYKSHSKTGVVAIKLYDAKGTLMYEKPFVNTQNGLLRHEIQVSQWVKGIYKLVIIEDEKATATILAIE
ncbi:MAG: hypothetical protein EAZ53_04010 [Bacteroidetes bacterium]|nr:MAG: hypothetical protein EAZ53_04010 [Bacteroidota bacterium]